MAKLKEYLSTGAPPVGTAWKCQPRGYPPERSASLGIVAGILFSKSVWTGGEAGLSAICLAG